MRGAMSVLTRDVILRELDEGRIRIDPMDRDQIGVASIDLTLGREIRVIMNDEESTTGITPRCARSRGPFGWNPV